MTETYYKAIRPDGTDWLTGKLRWLPEDGIIPEGGWLVEHPNPGPVGGGNAVGRLSVATAPTECTGMAWPTRLLRVEPVGEVWTPGPYGLPNKCAAHAWRVVEERPAHEALGPQGREVAALIETARGLTPDQLDAINAARVAALNSARDAAWYAALSAAQDAARKAALSAALNAAWDAAMSAARDAFLAVLVRDLITPGQYDILTGPWRTVMGDPMGQKEVLGDEQPRDCVEPPRAKYRLTVTITGNTLEEVEEELGYQVRGGFLLDSDYYKRDEWTVYGGTSTRVMECVDPDMTPERYQSELDEWWRARMEGTEVSNHVTDEAGGDADANLIASAPDRLARMERALRGVLERHRPIEVEPSDTICAACSNQLPNGRFLPVIEWPCPDVDAILEALG